MDMPSEERNSQAATAEGTGAPAASGQEPAQQDQAQLVEQLAKAQAEAAEYLDNWRRAVADMSNARKRMQREQAEITATAAARVLEKLIPIVDDVDRAFSALAPEVAQNDWVNGFRMIQRKLQTLLEGEGVTTIPAEGQVFDPTVHYAVSHEVHPELPEGSVIAEVSKGYKLGERVLQPAMVRVSKGPA
jgi:molecular chaperone GrpE